MNAGLCLPVEGQRQDVAVVWLLVKEKKEEQEAEEGCVNPWHDATVPTSLLPPPPLPPPSLSPLPSNTPTPTISKGYDSLTWFDKLELFGLWPTVALLGILCALANTIQSLSSHSHMDAFVEPALRLLLGFACLLLWLASVQYLEF